MMLMDLFHFFQKTQQIEAKDNKSGLIHLHLSCEYGQLPIVQYLIEKGAHVKAKDKDQYPPLHWFILI